MFNPDDRVKSTFPKLENTVEDNKPISFGGNLQELAMKHEMDQQSLLSVPIGEKDKVLSECSNSDFFKFCDDLIVEKMRVETPRSCELICFNSPNSDGGKPSEDGKETITGDTVESDEPPRPVEEDSYLKNLKTLEKLAVPISRKVLEAADSGISMKSVKESFVQDCVVRDRMIKYSDVSGRLTSVKPDKNYKSVRETLKDWEDYIKEGDESNKSHSKTIAGVEVLLVPSSIHLGAMDITLLNSGPVNGKQYHEDMKKVVSFFSKTLNSSSYSMGSNVNLLK